MAWKCQNKRCLVYYIFKAFAVPSSFKRENLRSRKQELNMSMKGRTKGIWKLTAVTWLWSMDRGDTSNIVRNAPFLLCH